MILDPTANGRGALSVPDITGEPFTAIDAVVSITVGLTVMLLVVTELL
jgi:hypothetical protein